MNVHRPDKTVARQYIFLSLIALCLIGAAHAAGQSGLNGVHPARRDDVTFGQSPESVYLFAYFKGNGEDGLHLARSDDGLVWRALNGDRSLLEPTVGKDRLMRDPHLSLGADGLFHLVWTSSWTDPVIGHATSRDLLHWSEQQGITPMTSEPAARNVWAPELFYDESAGRYLLFWATTIPGRFPATDESGDNGLNHRLYLTTTADFRAFTPTTLFYDGGFNVIDATIVKSGRRYLMFLKDETRHPTARKNLRYVVSRRAAGPYGQLSKVITGNYWAEGPTAIKIDNRWIVYFDKYQEHRYGAVASPDLRRWTDVSAQLKFPAGARHGTVIRVPTARIGELLKLE
ncbi:MAG TPA: glycoside hydrolase family 43 protein [Pyrinomonadaceae bacterium]|nr:glycoside hydrolase family 43 protein [Pyrinomonadaceae bacterium]